MRVLKNSGISAKMNHDKIDKQLNFITQGTDITLDVFKERLHINLYDGITTKDIQKNIIMTASNNITLDELDWDIVAGRAAMWELYGNVYKLTGYNSSNDWSEHIDWLIDNEYYRPLIREQLNKLNINSDYFTFDSRDNINLDTNIEFNKLLSQVMVDESKYLINTNQGIVEYPHLADIANSSLVSETRTEFGINHKLLSENTLSLATPFKKTLKRVSGNLGSCYIGESSDSLPGLFKSYTDIAMISKNGGGIGWYFGKIRPANTRGSNVLKSNDITYWAKIANDIIVAVDQNGTRKGALTFAIDWWHMDVYSFLDIKSELSGDLRMKAFDIFPQIILDDYFVDACLNEKYIYMYNHYDARKYIDKDVTELVDDELYQYHTDIAKLIEDGANISHTKIYAMEHYKKILWLWIEIGDLYITHKDNLNLSNYLKTDINGGIAKCGNLCVESFSISRAPTEWKEEYDGVNRVTTETNGLTHSCNLLSINVVNLIDKDEDFIKLVCRQAVRVLDKSIDFSDSPVKEAETASHSLRNISIGVLGLADWMAWNEAMYDKPEGVAKAVKLIEKLTYYCYVASMELAKEKEPYPLFNKDNYDKLLGKSTEELDEKSIITGNNFDWSKLKEDIKTHGIRNFYLMGYAPNTTTALSVGVLPSFLPAYNLLNYQTLNELSVAVKPVFLKEKFWYYKTRFNYNPIDIINFTGELQYYIDTGMSMEINLNTAVNSDIYSIGLAILNSFKKKLIKAVYYSLTIENHEKKDDKNDCKICKN